MSDLQPRLAELGEIVASRRRLRSRLLGRERAVTLLLAAGFLAAAAACALLLPGGRDVSPLAAVLLVAAYAAVSKIEFEVGPGSVVPTTLVLVPMLFLLPPGLVPLCVAAGLLLAGLADRVRGRMHGERAAVLLCSSWHAVGPALVIGLGAPGAPRWSAAPVYLGALAAQLALDEAAVLARHVGGRGVPASRLVGPLGWAALVDVALAPVGLLAAFAAARTPVAAAAVLPLAGLLYLFERDRRRRIDESVALGEAVEDASRTARSDPLTGLGNRLAWDEAFERAAEADGPASVLLVDLNELKETNDTHGHHAGDLLIQTLAAALRDALPSGIEPARIGGDEFAAVASGLDERAAEELVEQVRSRLAGLVADGLAVTVSIGVASRPPCRTLAEALRVADERLYAAKARSRALRRAAGA